MADLGAISNNFLNSQVCENEWTDYISLYVTWVGFC